MSQADPAGQATNGQGKQKLVLVLITLLVPLLMAECGIRLIDAARGDGFFNDSRNILVRSDNIWLPFRSFGVSNYAEKDGERFISSRHGELYPLEKPKGTLRIVVFGGSTTVNEYSVKRGGGHYPLVLQELLNQRLAQKVEVINVGFSSYATPHSLILFELDVLSWNPDIVILSHNYNDLSAGYFPDFTYSYAHKYGSTSFKPPGQRRFGIFTELFLQHSQLYWVARGRFQNLVAKLTYQIRRRSYGMEPPQEVQDVFRRNLESFITLAKANDIQVVLGTQPMEPSEEYFLKHAAAKPYNEFVFYPLHEELLAHHEYFNEILRQEARERDVWLVDNAAVMNGKTEYFSDHVHYTVEGVARLARNYADVIAAKLGAGAPSRAAPGG